MLALYDFPPRGCLSVSSRDGCAPVAAVGARLLLSTTTLGTSGGVFICAAFSAAVYACGAVG